MTWQDLEEYYIQYEDVENCLAVAPLFNEALKRLQAMGMVEVLRDHFGPTHFRKGAHFDEMWEQLTTDRTSPFYKYAALTSPNHWLIQAIHRANEVYSELLISEQDFVSPPEESQDQAWEPIPLSRDDPSLLAAIASLEKVIADVQQSNGYAASSLEERNYVLDGLRNTAHPLREAASTSYPYLKRYALEPLGLVIKRFWGTLTSVAATAARDALLAFIKQHGSKLVDLVSKQLGL